jgi:thymidylate synthase (FAD)
MSKQLVELTYITPLWVIAKGIRYSHDNHHLSDTEKNKADYLLAKNLRDEEIDVIELDHYIGPRDYNLIKRIGFHQNHQSVLEHSLIVFNVKMTTKALLEESRHRISVSQTVTSSRYALDIIDIEYSKVNDDEKIDNFLENYRQACIKLIDSYRNEKGKISKKDMDNLAMILPQAFIYKMQLTFNLRSLLHFLELRLSKSAHWSIREIAKQVFEALPKDYQGLILEQERIKRELKD